MHNIKTFISFSLTSSLVSWKKRACHTSSTFQMGSTHTRGVVFGGCPGDVEPQDYPLLSDTIIVDIIKYFSLLLLH